MLWKLSRPSHGFDVSLMKGWLPQALLPVPICMHAFTHAHTVFRADHLPCCRLVLTAAHCFGEPGDGQIPAASPENFTSIGLDAADFPPSLAPGQPLEPRGGG